MAAAEPAGPASAIPMLKLVGLAASIALAFALAYHLGWFDAHFRDRLQGFLRTLGPWAPAAFMAIKVATVVLALPSAPVTFTGGLLFGPVWGTLINVVAATVGASCTFFISRRLGRAAVEPHLKGKLKALDEGLGRNGLSYMLFLRLVPLFPFNGINYGAGLTRMRFRDYFWGTLIGIIPGAAVFTYLGSAAADASPTKFLIGMAALGALSLIPVFVRKRQGAPLKSPDIYDLVVIGGGSGGLVAAGGAALFGAKVALVEKHELLGGDCLHFGCVPSKALIRTAHAAHDVRTAARFGTHVERAHSSVSEALAYVRTVVKQIGVHDDADRFRQMGVEVITGVAPTFLSPRTLAVGERVLTSRAFVIATGSRPAAPPGLADVGAFDNETIFYKLQGEPKRMAVIGGGPIGVELGQAFARLGVKVTIIELAERLLVKEDLAVSALIAATLRAEGLDLRLQSQVVGARKVGETTVLTLETPDAKLESLEVEVVLSAAGRKPNVEGLGLEAAGVKLDARGFIAVDERMRTNVGHVYAVGDVIGKFPFTHMAEAEAKVALRNALFPGTGKMNYEVVPWATFCDPEVGRVGPLEADLVATGTPYRVFTFPYHDADRALTDDRTAGFIKLLTKPSGHILGATIVGASAGESIQEYVLAMKHGLRVQELSNTIHTYPTLVLANRRAADQFMLAKLNDSLGGKLLRWWVGRGGERRPVPPI